MRLFFVLFNSLSRLALGPYGGAIETTNFGRIAEKAVTFDRHYVGSAGGQAQMRANAL